MKNRRIQIIRAILAVIVIIIHTLPDNYMIKVFARPVLNVAVAGFLFLSGYLTKTKIDVKSFYKKRLFAVLIPYVLFTILYTIISNIELGPSELLSLTAKNLITTQGKNILYYLIVYAQFVLLTPLLIRIAVQKKTILNTIILLIQPLFVLCFYIGVMNGTIIKKLHGILCSFQCGSRIITLVY